MQKERNCSNQLSGLRVGPRESIRSAHEAQMGRAKVCSHHWDICKCTHFLSVRGSSALSRGRAKIPQGGKSNGLWLLVWNRLNRLHGKTVSWIPFEHTGPGAFLLLKGRWNLQTGSMGRLEAVTTGFNLNHYLAYYLSVKQKRKLLHCKINSFHSPSARLFCVYAVLDILRTWNKR